MIERQNIRDEDEDVGEEETEIFYLQLAQCVVILTSLLAVYVQIKEIYSDGLYINFFTDITDLKIHVFKSIQ